MSMNVVSKKIADLHLAEKNVRRHPQKQLEELRRSMDMFGQYRPLVVDSDGQVLVGNGLLAALMETDTEEIDCIVLPANTPESYKKKLMMADNKIFSLGADSATVIDEFISEIQDFDIPGFDENILEQLYTEVEAEAGKIPENIIASSGVIPESRREEIQRTAEARVENPPEDNEEKYAKVEAVMEQQEGNEGKPYITCPHCGVKIYGYN